MHYLIYGASRGLGAYLATHLPQRDDHIWLVSRGQPDLRTDDGVVRHWIAQDLADPAAGARIATAIGDLPLDVVIYNAGIWESTAFSSNYQYEDVPDDEMIRVLTVNLTSAVLCLKRIVPHLRRSARPRLIVSGSISGLENVGYPEVAYNASKFGLRGMVHALREALRADHIPVTCLNLGTIASSDAETAWIPYADICAVIKTIVGLSNRSILKEIDFFAQADANA